MEELKLKNEEANELITILRAKIDLLKQKNIDVSKYEGESLSIYNENKELAKKIESMKSKLVKTELLNGELQVELPKVVKSEQPEQKKEVKKETVQVEKKATHTAAPKEVKPAKVAENKPQTKSKESSETIDVSRFDMRIGRILEVTKHAEADSLYVEKVDVGESKPRQVVSGLVKYCSELELQDRLGVFLLNLKPAKMRGVLSEGMIMCASSPDTGVVEPLIVPPGARPGDRVTVEGYPSNPDDVMNPKKKILETVKPDLKVDSNGVATYRGARWVLNGEAGVIVSTKLKDTPIA